MNRSKRAISNKLRKKMTKEIRTAQAAYPVPESRQYSDELTTKEMLKKYPKKVAKKQTELLDAAEMRFAIKKKKHQKLISKRTTPGTVPSDSTPANTQREGKRWIKTLTEQTRTQRIEQRHSANKKK